MPHPGDTLKPEGRQRKREENAGALLAAAKPVGGFRRAGEHSERLRVFGDERVRLIDLPALFDEGRLAVDARD
jgi:hypothetical protein